MTDPASAATLIGEDRRFQEAYWSFQRWAWAAFAAVILLAILGFAGGGGPFSKQTVRSGVALIDAPRIMRWEAEDQMYVRQGVAPRESVEVVLSPEFSNSIAIRSVSPAPFQTATSRAGTSYWFFQEPGSQASIVFHLKPIRPALRFRGSISVGDGNPVELPLAILP